MDAIEAAIKILEDNPLFNAGKGAVFTAEGKNELDAAIMDGATLKAGAVAGMTRTRHPISLARAVMEKSPHVMLIGAGADAFAAHVGLEQVDPSYFFTERRWQSLVKQLKKEGLPIPPRPAGAPPAPAEAGGGAGAAGGAQIRHGRRGGAGPARKHRRGNFDGRHAGQEVGERGRLADHRCRDLCVESVVRSVGDGYGGVLHPAGRGARSLQSGVLQGHAGSAGSR